MTFEIYDTLTNLQRRFAGYLMLMTYRYSNLCVKSDPSAMLSTNVIVDEAEQTIEKVAKVAIPNSYQFYLLPLDNCLIPAICKGVLAEHPEFRQEIQDDPDSEGMKMVVLTVPPVDKNRKDAMLDMVDALYKDCDLRMKADFDIAAAKATALALPLPKETQDETKDEFQKMYDQHVEMAKTAKEDKVKEIEEAYAHFCEENDKEEKKAQEESDSKGEDNMFKMTLDS